ncbi:MAG: cobyrinate a,c-diamide synthase [Actinomycetota bacterium]|nr:cobyrinate a,c-diamide synthase [Actinomycetota bacterium]
MAGNSLAGAVDSLAGAVDTAANVLGPRLVVAGTHSGVGKTTVATGLMAALARTGVRVTSAKVGPDYIDPGYHALATGRPARNLDAFLCGEPAMAPLAARAAGGGDLLVVEGVMGLFDGAGSSLEASTAALAMTLAAPVLLVVDASAMSGSVAAVVHGYHSFVPGLAVAGVVLNRVGSAGHEALLRSALAPLGVPVLGALPRDDAFGWRDRHLGLVPVVEDPAGIRHRLDRLAEAVAARLDLARIVALAQSAPPLRTAGLSSARRCGRAVVAVAGGPAFSFAYPDNLERLVEAGAEVVPFDPLADAELPAGATALYAGGGFPEVYVEALAANRPLLEDVAAKVAGGLVTWAECGGLLWLTRSLDGRRLAGPVPADATMTPRLTLGYRRAVLQADCPIGPAGTELRGHEFHYSTVSPPGTALVPAPGAGGQPGGFASTSLLASYLHLHLGADPAPAERFVARAAPPQRRESDRGRRGRGHPDDPPALRGAERPVRGGSAQAPSHRCTAGRIGRSHDL